MGGSWVRTLGAGSRVMGSVEKYVVRTTPGSKARGSTGAMHCRAASIGMEAENEGEY